jgi:hypothetical protein
MHPALAPIKVGDPGIQRAVNLLRRAGISTCQSCEADRGIRPRTPTLNSSAQRAKAGERWRSLPHAAGSRGSDSYRYALAERGMSRTMNRMGRSGL